MSSSMAEKPACCLTRVWRTRRPARNLHAVDPDSRGRAVAESHLMTTQPEWPRIAVVGAGAVGGYFVGMLSRAARPSR